MGARAEAFRLPPAPGRIGPRALVLLGLLGAGWVAAWGLDLTWAGLVPGPGGRRIALQFFSRAFSPALAYETAVPAETPPLLLKCLVAAGDTVLFAAAALGLALVLALPLGFLAATAWWSGEAVGGESFWERFRRRSLGPLVFGLVRPLLAVLRSVHELLWAVLLLSAFGLTPVAAVIAIALPYAGTLAKVFAEMVDEAPRDAAGALLTAGATPLQVFLVGLLPRAFPDLAAYTFYRFECALRSSAVMGFFGFPTLGYYLAAAFENLHYGEVWTYLYTLFGLVAVADLWSGALRRRLIP
jgi:phosphonate transport system permease protein